MLCPKCSNQYDIYNAIVNEELGCWECPDCKVELIMENKEIEEA